MSSETPAPGLSGASGHLGADENEPLLVDGRPHFDGVDPNEARHRREAVRRHRQRIVTQGASALFAALIVAGAPLYWRGLLLACGFELSAAWPASAAEKILATALRGEGGIAAPLLASLLFIPFVFVFASAFYLSVRYRFLRDKDWQLRSAEAEANEPRTAAFGPWP